MNGDSSMDNPAQAQWQAQQMLTAGRLDEARFLYEQARAGFDQVGFAEGVGTTACNLAQIHQLQGRLDAAREAVDRALEVLDAPRLRAVALSTLGSVRLDDGDLDGAMGALSEAMELDQEGTRRAAATALMGVVHHAAERLEMAEVHFDRALAVAEATWDNRLHADSLAGLAALRQEQGRFEEARSAYGHAETMQRHGKDPIGRCRTLVGQAILSLELGEPDARKALDKARPLASPSRPLSGVVEGWLAVSNEDPSRLERADALIGDHWLRRALLEAQSALVQGTTYEPGNARVSTAVRAAMRIAASKDR